MRVVILLLIIITILLVVSVTVETISLAPVYWNHSNPM